MPLERQGQMRNRRPPMPSPNAPQAPDAAIDPGYVFTLSVASLTPRSVTAIQSVKEICEKYLSGQYSLVSEAD